MRRREFLAPFKIFPASTCGTNQDPFLLACPGARQTEMFSAEDFPFS